MIYSIMFVITFAALLYGSYRYPETVVRNYKEIMGENSEFDNTDSLLVISAFLAYSVLWVATIPTTIFIVGIIYLGKFIFKR